jgi:nitrogenase molybdenum-iron protein alpha/beta subunit
MKDLMHCCCWLDEEEIRATARRLEKRFNIPHIVEHNFGIMDVCSFLPLVLEHSRSNS